MRMNTLLTTLAASALLLGLTACGGADSRPRMKTLSPPTPTANAPAANATSDSNKPRPAKEGWSKPKDNPNEVVFDPANPPEGYTRCHRNHCHKVGGGVASYQQVMNEMGATKVKGQVSPDQMPPAPKDVATPPAGAEKTASGLASLVLTKGSGTRKPSATSRVRVHYTGWTTDGRMFDSSVARGTTISFPLNRVIAGWTEGVQLMTVGDKFRFWIPSQMAYGDNPGGGRPGGMLVFDVELLKILK